MRQVLIRTFLFGVIFLATAEFTHAASLYIDPPKSTLNRGDAIELSIRLDTDEAAEECVNAVDAVLTYTSNIEPVDVSIGDSIFSIWVEQPTINKEEKTISFAGGMPNGYCGRVTGDPRLTNSLVKLIFRSPGFTVGGGSNDSNIASVSFTDQTSAYLNDGFGTQVSPRTFGASMELNPRAGGGIVDPWRESVALDTTPPEEFSIFLEKDPRAFSGKYYISFNTTDKQTGIDLYQVMEEPLEKFGAFDWGRADAPWITARSPYILEDQSLNITIRVRAIDKAGNEYIATLLPDESMRTTSSGQTANRLVFGLIGLIILGCLGVVIMYIIQRVRRKATRSEAAREVDGEKQDDFEEENNESEHDESEK